MARIWNATTEVYGPLHDQVRLYTRNTPRPRTLLLSVNEATSETPGASGATLSFNEALQLVQGMIDYFEMTGYDVILPKEDK